MYVVLRGHDRLNIRLFRNTERHRATQSNTGRHRATPFTVILLFRSSLRERVVQTTTTSSCDLCPHPTTIHTMRERDCVVIVVLSSSSETRLHVSTAFLPAGVPALRPSAENTVWWAGDGHEFASQKTDELMQVCASRCHMLLLWLLCESVRSAMRLPLKLTATVKSFTVGINTSCSRPLRIVHFRNNSSDNNNDSVLRAVPFKGPHSQSHASISPQQHQQTLCPLSLHPSIWF